MTFGEVKPGNAVEESSVHVNMAGLSVTLPHQPILSVLDSNTLYILQTTIRWTWPSVPY